MRAFYCSFISAEFVHLIRHLYSEHKIKPVALLTDAQAKLAELARAEHPDLLVLDIYNTRRGVFEDNCKNPNSKFCADEDVLMRFSAYEPIVMEQFERMDATGSAFTYTQRKRLYRDLLKLWSDFLDIAKPDVLFFKNVPHFPSEYVLYLLCQERKIPTLLTDLTSVNPRVVIVDSIHQRGDFFYKFNLSLGEQLPTDTQVRIDAIRSNAKQAVPYYLQDIINEEKRRKTLWFKISRGWQLFMRLRSIFEPSRVSLKRNTLPVDDIRSGFNYWQKYFYFKNAARKIRENKKIYDQISSAVDYKQKYVLFAAHYQPERTTCPDAFYYSDMFAQLDVLSAELPKGWKIIYKEHPTNFRVPGKILFRGHMSRNAEYFARLQRYSNLVIASMSEDTQKLIDHSQAVAVATGTAGWEAILKSKPVLVFGEAWYASCPAFFRIRSQSDLRAAYNKILQGYKPSETDIHKLCLIVEKITEGNMNSADYDWLHIKTEEEKIRLVKDYAESFVHTMRLLRMIGSVKELMT